MIKDAVFVSFAGLTILGAFCAVWLKNVFYNALGLILSLFGVAALFIFLNSDFLAVMEVILYIGAIAIAIIFAIMLSKLGLRQNEPRSVVKITRSAAIAALVFILLQRTVRETSWTPASPDGDYLMRAIGKQLLTVYALPFEVVSVVLLVAIIGALLLSGQDA